MKRFLNSARTVSIAPFSDGYSGKFRLVNQSDAVDNEIVTGEIGGKRYFFLVKQVTVGGETSKQLLSLSHDDLTLDFVRIENDQLGGAFSGLASNIDSITVGNLVGDDDGVS
jgi:hypothetical protein